ncbi:hypothetical protein CGZ91_09385, partial [Parenemella sanctibonifatiensis]
MALALVAQLWSPLERDAIAQEPSLDPVIDRTAETVVPLPPVAGLPGVPAGLTPDVPVAATNAELMPTVMPVAPVDGALEVGSRPQLQARVADGDPQLPYTYEFTVVRAGTGEVVESSGRVGAAWSPTTDLAAGSYGWSVRAWGVDGVVGESQWWFFTTDAYPNIPVAGARLVDVSWGEAVDLQPSIGVDVTHPVQGAGFEYLVQVRLSTAAGSVPVAWQSDWVRVPSAVEVPAAAGLVWDQAYRVEVVAVQWRAGAPVPGTESSAAVGKLRTPVGLPDAVPVDESMPVGPVSSGTGGLRLQDTDGGVASVGWPLELARHYSSTAGDRGVFGVGWSSVLDMRAVQVQGRVKVRMPDGHDEVWARNPDGGFVSATRQQLPQLACADAGCDAWQVRDTDQMLYTISGAGVEQIEAPSGAVTRFERDAAGVVTRIVDVESGRALELGWDGDLLTAVAATPTLADGRLEWSYRYDSQGRMVRSCRPFLADRDGCTQYRFEDPDSPAVSSVIGPDGATTWQVDYAPYQNGQVSSFTDAAGDTVTVTRRKVPTGVAGSLAAVTMTDGPVPGRRQTIVTNDLGQVTRAVTGSESEQWLYDGYGRLQLHTGADGARTWWYWDPGTGAMTYRITERSATAKVVESFTYTRTGQLLSVSDPRQGINHRSLTSYRYSNGGEGGQLVSRRLGADGPVETFTYTTGQEPAIGGGQVPAGLLASETVPGRGATHYGYDRLGQVRSITQPAGAVTSYDYDPLGRLVEMGTTAQGSSTRQVRVLDPDGFAAVITTDAETDEVSGVQRQLRQINERDDAGRITAEIAQDVVSGERLGIRRSYDPAGRVVSTQDLTGRVLSAASYGPGGCQSSATDANGSVTRFTCDVWGRPLTTTLSGYHDPTRTQAPTDVALETVSYDPAGRIATSVDVYGTTRTFSYTRDGLLTRVESTTKTGEQRLDYTAEHDALGNVVSSWTPQQGQMRWVFDDYGRLIETWQLVEGANIVADHTRRTSLRYDPGTGQVIAETVDGGAAGVEDDHVTLTYRYDAHGRLIHTESGRGGQIRTQHWRGYDQAGRVVWQTDGRGNAAQDPAHTSHYTYDSSGRLTATTSPPVASTRANPDGTLQAPETGPQVTRHGYDSLGRPAMTVDPDGSTTRLSYSPTGQLVTMTEPQTLTDTGPVLPQWQFSYTDSDQVASVTDPAGRTTSYTYDSAGMLVETTEPALNPGEDPRVTRQEWTPAGDLAATIDPTGARVDYAYDNYGQLTSSTAHVSGQAHTTGYGWDQAGNLTHLTSPAGGETRLHYNSAGDQIRHVDPDGITTTTAVDLAGNPTRQQDGSGVVVSAYDDAGHLTGTSTAGLDGTVVDRVDLAYDPAGNLTAITGPLGTGQLRRYDALNQLTDLIQPGEGRYRLSYDTSGHVVALTDPNQAQTTYTWTARGQLATETFPATSQHPALADRQRTLTYDLSGNPVAVTEPGGIEHHTWFDTDGNTTRVEAAGPGVTAVNETYQWDPAGRLVAASHPQGTQHFTWDEAGQLTTTTGPAGNTTYTWDPDGNLTDITGDTGTAHYTWTPAGRPHQATDGGITTTYTYNSTGLPADVTTSTGLTQKHLYDPAGRPLITTTQQDGAVLDRETNTYDLAGRLTNTSHTGSIDLPPQLGYSYDERDRLTGWTDPDGAHTLTYDNANNLIDHDGTAITHNQRNQPTTITTPHGTTTLAHNPAGNRTTSTTGQPLQWDALGRLTADGDTNYHYDALGRLSTSTTNGNDTTYTYRGLNPEPTTTNHGDTWTRDTNGTLTAIDGTSILTDTPRNPIAVLDTPPHTSTWTPYGTTTNTPDQPTPGYQQHLTSPTGHTLMGARWYDPTTATFLTPDPTRPTITETANLYHYAHNNPITNNDPTGTRACPGGGGHIRSMSIGCGGIAGAIADATRNIPSTATHHTTPTYRSPSKSRIGTSRPGNTPRTTTPKTTGRGPTTPAPIATPTNFNDPTWHLTNPGDITTYTPPPPAQLPMQSPAIDESKPPTVAGIDLQPVQRPTTNTPPLAQLERPCGVIENTIDSKTGKFTPDFTMGGNHGFIPCPKTPEERLALLLDAGKRLLAFTVGTVLPIVATTAVCLGTAGAGCVLAGAAFSGLGYLAETAITGEPIDPALLALSILPIPGGGGKIAATGAKGAAKTLSPRLPRVAPRVVPSTSNRTAARMCSFGATTQVLMGDGTAKAISEIKPGDLVTATDPETGEQIETAVEQVWIHDDTFTNLHLETETITTTEDHPFWSTTNKAFIRADQLQPGDQVLTADGATHTVTGTTPNAGSGAAYNLSVANIHTYHVGNSRVLVHNDCFPGLDDLAAAGQLPDRNGLTAAGRSYQKHAGRNELPQVPGSALNDAG